MRLFERLKNIITGKDLNFDGKVDIKDKFNAAERKGHTSKPAKERK